MGTKHEVVSARTLRRVVRELERLIENSVEGVGRETQQRIDATRNELLDEVISTIGLVKSLRDELSAALARKPNAVLQQWVYQLRTTRAELALVQETLEKNTAVLERFTRAMELVDIQRSETIRTIGGSGDGNQDPARRSAERSPV